MATAVLQSVRKILRLFVGEMSTQIPFPGRETGNAITAPQQQLL